MGNNSNIGKTPPPNLSHYQSVYDIVTQDFKYPLINEFETSQNKQNINQIDQQRITKLQQEQWQEQRNQKQQEYLANQGKKRLQTIIDEIHGLKSYQKNISITFWGSLSYIGIASQFVLSLPYPFLLYSFGKTLSIGSMVGLFLSNKNIIQDPKSGAPLIETTKLRAVTYGIGCFGICLQSIPLISMVEKEIIVTNFLVSLFVWKSVNWIALHGTYRMEKPQSVFLASTVASLILLNEGSYEMLGVWAFSSALVSTNLVNDYYNGEPDHLFVSLLYLIVVSSFCIELSTNILEKTMTGNNSDDDGIVSQKSVEKEIESEEKKSQNGEISNKLNETNEQEKKKD